MIASPSSTSSGPRTSQACDSCRVRKSRCLPSDNPGICLRCLKSKTTCVYSNKNKGNVTTGQRVLRQLQPAKNEPDVFPRLFKSEDVSEGFSFADHHREMLEKLFPQVLVPPNFVETGKQDSRTSVVTNVPVSMNDVQKYVEAYQRVNQFSPYVPLPSNWTVNDMVENHPVLTMAILASMSEKETQYVFDYRFRQLMAERLVVQGHHSLDILQGLLVYLAWCPLFLNPRRGRLYQIVQMVLTLVRDLKYDMDAPSMDAKRAYLGACYLCSCLAVPPRRPNGLPFTEYSRACLLSIASQRESGLDKILVSMLTLQQIEEDAISMPLLDNSLLQSMLCQVQLMGHLGHTLNGYLELMRKYVVMKIHLAAMPHLKNQQPTLGDQCIAAIRDVFDGYLALDDSGWHSLPSNEFSRLVHTVIGLFTLFNMIPAGNGDIGQFGNHLASIQMRMGGLTLWRSDRYAISEVVFGTVKEKYDRMVEEGVIVNMASMCPALSPDFPLAQFAYSVEDEFFPQTMNIYSSEYTPTDSSG